MSRPDAKQITGALAVANGGTGADQSAIAKGGLLIGTAAGAIGIKAVGTDGQVLSADAASAGGTKWVAASPASGGGWDDDGTVVRLTDITDSVGIGTITPNEQLEITKNLRIAPTADAVGQIKMGAERFIHAFGDSGVAGRTNTFCGRRSGNVTMVSSATDARDNVGIGLDTLKSLTIGANNTAVGSNAMAAATVAVSECAIGSGALQNDVSGARNCAIGYSAMAASVSAGGNVALGSGALESLVSGNGDNVAIGYGAGEDLTTGYENVLVGRGAGSLATTEIRNTCIGAASFTPAGVEYSIALGVAAQAAASHTCAIGNAGAFAVSVVVGGTTALARLDVIEQSIGYPVQRLASIATSDDPAEMVYQNRVATTDATQTTLHTFVIPATTTVMIEANVVARRTGGALGTAEDGAAYKLMAAYKNIAGVATIIGAIALGLSVEDQAPWDATLIPDGAANVNLKVTGAAQNDVTWHMTTRVWKVGS